MRRRDDIVEILRQRVISGIHFGTLERGAKLPSARTVSAELHADPRVVLAAYRRLESEGLIEQRAGSRAFFTAVGRSAGDSLAPTSEWLVELLIQALDHGVHAPSLPEHVRHCLETLRLRAACIECNADQLRWLCSEIADDYGIESTPVDVEDIEHGPLPAAMRQADIWVTTASHSSMVRPLSRQHGKPLLVVSLRPELVDEIGRLLESGPIYYIFTDPRFATKLPYLYASAPGAANVRAVLLGRDDPADIPAGAAAWVMRSARQQLGNKLQNIRLLSTLRVFSNETARELLSFIVRSNLAALAAQQSSGAASALAG
jgi:DNA-binding transcriptional regulator YhcF (GntR family)